MSKYIEKRVIMSLKVVLDLFIFYEVCSSNTKSDFVATSKIYFFNFFNFLFDLWRTTAESY
jgi:hypothetical protein